LPSPRVAHCIFCDDIRFERGNKISFMGVYGGDMLISSPKPAMMRIGIVAWVISDIDDAPTSIKVRGTGPTADAMLFEGTFNYPPPPPGGPNLKRAILRADVQLEQLVIPDDGQLSVFVHVGDEEPIRAGLLSIKFVAQPAAEIPTALASSILPPQPSPQSSDVQKPTETKPARARPSRHRASPKRKP
jgi:hypothetical protein